MYKKLAILFCLSILSYTISAQAIQLGGADSTGIDFSSTHEYEIGGITVTGADHLDQNVLILLSGLSVGEKVQIPGDKISTAIENLWKQGLLQDIKITATKIQGSTIFMNITVEERPRLSKFSLKGMTKSEADDLREKIKLIKGKVVTDGMISSTQNLVKDFFVNKAYLDVKVDIKKENDAKLDNSVILYITVKKGNKVRVKDINIIGNTSLGTFKLLRTFKETKRKRWWNPFNNGKFDESNFEKDKKAFVSKYNSKGFRDMQITRDTMYTGYCKTKLIKGKYIAAAYKRITQGTPMNAQSYHRIVKKNPVKFRLFQSLKTFHMVRDSNYYKRFLTIDMYVTEGKKYYFRKINWVGNSKYSSKELNNVLGIKRGDVYDQENLDSKLFMNQNGNDISSLYMDDGYLFFNVSPVEVMVSNDSIDLEMRIFEGKQAIINKVTIVGNTKTNDHVILREIRTKPGQLFRRSDIIRSQRELSQLGYFNPEKMNVTPTPNPATGTVDIEYTVEEKPSDQIELSGGYGNKMVVGTLGVTFNNFSAKNFLKKDSWRPLPSGDGQRLSVRAQSSGLLYQSYNMSFTEPWLGGRKPNSLSVTTYYTVQSNGLARKITNSDGEKVTNPARTSLDIIGASVGLGKRLKWPDDYFSFYHELAYQYYILNNYASMFTFSKGHSNNIFYKASLQRNSLQGNPIFPSGGSQITLTGQWTPPYSYFNNKDYTNPAMTVQERFQFVEYQKYKFASNFYIPITNKRGADGKEARNLILRASAGFGLLSPYNTQVGQSPFERFYLGGSGLTGYALDGREIIALRGYNDQSLSPTTGASFIAKYTMELRFPVTLNPQATIFALGFVEAGNSWTDAKSFNPFNVYRSTGLGIRVFLPMFGLLGFDYGWRLDDVPTNLGMQKGQFHFTIGAAIGEL